VSMTKPIVAVQVNLHIAGPGGSADADATVEKIGAGMVVGPPGMQHLHRFRSIDRYQSRRIE